MSGGSRDYICYKIENELCGQMYDDELNDLMEDVSKLAHDVEWLDSSDIGEDGYMKTVAEFKQKWFKGDRQTRLKSYIDRQIEDIRKKMYALIGGGHHMSKSDQIALGRNQGLDLARRIVAQAQQDGIDPLKALDMEIRSRHIIGIAAKMTKSEWEKEFAAAMELAYKAAMVIAMAVLWGDFGWGGVKRLPKFCSAYLNYLMEIGRQNTSITELVELLETKAGVHVDLAEKGFTADFRKAKGKDRIA